MSSVEAGDKLFNAYKKSFGADKNRTDFYSFLTIPSADRDLFLQNEAITETSNAGSVLILNAKSK